MRPRRLQNITLAHVFGIRVGVSTSWFFVLFLLIFWLGHDYFPSIVDSSGTTEYLIAVGGALGYFLSLILHELGHALAARRLGIEVDGIDLWFLGGLSKMRREPATPGEEFKVAAAGPLVTLLLLAIAAGAGVALSGNHPFTESLTSETFTTTPAVALAGWLALINAALFVFNIIPAFPLDGGRIARAVIWRASGDRNRATAWTGRAGQALGLAIGLLGLLDLSRSGNLLSVVTLFLAFVIYQAAGQAVLQGAIGRRIENVTVADIMDREPVTIEAGITLLDAREQYFMRYHWPWFVVVDPARHFLGVVRQQRVEAEIAAGRPALEITDALEPDLPVRIGDEAPLETLLGAEGLGRLGAMVAVDADGVLQGVVTLAQVRRALTPAG